MVVLSDCSPSAGGGQIPSFSADMHTTGADSSFNIASLSGLLREVAHVCVASRILRSSFRWAVTSVSSSDITTVGVAQTMVNSSHCAVLIMTRVLSHRRFDTRFDKRRFLLQTGLGLVVVAEQPKHRWAIDIYGSRMTHYYHTSTKIICNDALLPFLLWNDNFFPVLQ